MKRFCTKLVFVFFALFICTNSFAQENETQTDTLQKSKRLTPGKVALLAIIPGAGQIYNRKYWKAPVVYILAGACVYGVITFQHQFDDFNSALDDRKTTDENNILSPNNPAPYKNDLNRQYTQAGLESAANYAHKNRDLCGLGVLAVYVLNIVDAYVDAHLMEFDVNDKLALRVNPDMRYSFASGVTPQLSLTLKFK